VQHLNRSKCIEIARRKNVSLVSMNMMNTFPSIFSEDDSNGYTRNDMNNLGRDAVIKGKCEPAILEEKESSDDGNDDFQYYSNYSNDNDSHDWSYMARHKVIHWKKPIPYEYHEKNHSHIAYVLQCMEDELSENNN